MDRISVGRHIGMCLPRGTLRHLVPTARFTIHSAQVGGGTLVSCTIELEENYQIATSRTSMKLRRGGIVKIGEKED